MCVDSIPDERVMQVWSFEEFLEIFYREREWVTGKRKEKKKGEEKDREIWCGKNGEVGLIYIPNYSKNCPNAYQNILFAQKILTIFVKF